MGDRECILRNIERVVALKPKLDQTETPKANEKAKGSRMRKQKSAKKKLCVICSDEEANYITIPCGHIAVGSKCVRKVEESKKCAFCGHSITNIIKCFHVGL